MSRSPFSRPIHVRDVPAQGRHFRIEAAAEERTGVADLLGIPGIEALEAEIELRPLAGRGFGVTGQVCAVVIQTDIVTLEPIRQEVSESVDVTMMPAERPRQKAGSTGNAADSGGADEQDVFSDGRIDIGAIATEHVALGLDPYPKAADVTFPGHIEDDPAGDRSPFAALAGLKKNDT